MAASCKFNGCSHQECPLYLSFQSRKGERTLLSDCLVLPRKLLLGSQRVLKTVQCFSSACLCNLMHLFMWDLHPSHKQPNTLIVPLPTFGVSGLLCQLLHCTARSCARRQAKEAPERPRWGPGRQIVCRRRLLEKLKGRSPT